MALATLIVLALSGGPVRQEDPRLTLIPSVNVRGKEVRDVVRTLFKQAKVDYTIDPQVSGPVTLNVKNLRLEVVLDRILRQVDAFSRVENGVWHVIRNDTEISPPVTVKDEMRDVGLVLQEIFRKAGRRYVLDPTVKGKVVLPISTASVEDTLTFVLRQVDARYVVQNGVYLISLTPQQAPKDPGGGMGDPNAIRFPRAARPPRVSRLIFSDETHLYVSWGDDLLRVRKSDLKIESRVSLAPILKYP